MRFKLIFCLVILLLVSFKSQVLAQETFGPTCEASICPTNTTAPTSAPPVSGSIETTIALLGLSTVAIIVGGSVFLYSSKSS